jgi:hypothetical protein
MRDKVRLAQQIVYASKATKVAKASQFGIMASAVLTFLIFAISYYGQLVGNFTFTIDRMADGVGIAMYENSEEKVYTTILRTTRVDNADGMTAYCGTEYSIFKPGDGVCIPSDEVLGSVDGPNNGISYMVYTYYVENTGDLMVDLVARINVISASNGAEESIRVRVIFNGVGTTYARRQTIYGPQPGEAEPLTQPFYSMTQVLNQDFIEFKPRDVLKVTVIIWYEGDDPDHTNAILGGGVKFDMSIGITKIYET